MYKKEKNNENNENNRKKNILKIEGINFNRGRMNYADLSMVIDKSATAIIGKNGVGKSSLLEKIVLFSKRDKGDIILNDCSIKKLSLDERSKRIGYLSHSEKPGFDFKVLDFAVLGRYPHHRGNVKQNDIDVCMKYLERLNILYLQDKGVFSLSKGEFQKVCLVRTLSLEPDVLLLDEPFSNLDLNSIQNLLNVLKMEVENNRMVIASFHDVNLVKKFSNNSFVLFYDSYIEHVDRIDENNLSNVYGIKLRSVEDNYFVF